MSLFEKRLAYLINHQSADALRAIRVGLEREALRVSPDGHLSQRQHPAALGSALMHPEITTDYSEALIEFVTPAFATPEATLERLDQIQHFSVQQLGDEMLWNASMPCVLEGEARIPIAQYGSSLLAHFKHLYREGLAYRYGKAMQTIAGIHYNFSFDEATWPVWQAMQAAEGMPLTVTPAKDPQEFRSQRYLDLVRNVQRTGFVIPYLFGASPAVCRSFFGGKEAHLPHLDSKTDGLVNGTSLRLSDLGYSNRKCPFFVSTNALDSYLSDLNRATNTPCDAFVAIGVKQGGDYRQLNANILQIENEYYSSIRPKQPPRADETPRQALGRRGIAYVEMRMLDVSPFLPTGVDIETLRFIQTWLTVCFLMDSPPITRYEKTALDSNVLSVAANGRSDEAILDIDHQPHTVSQALVPLFKQLRAVAELLGPLYVGSVNKQWAKVENPALTPSAQMLHEMRDRQETFHQWVQRWSHTHAEHYRQRPLSPELRAEFEAMAETSRERQQALEAADAASGMDFDAYLAAYFRNAALP